METLGPEELAELTALPHSAYPAPSLCLVEETAISAVHNPAAALRLQKSVHSVVHVVEAEESVPP